MEYRPKEESGILIFKRARIMLDIGISKEELEELYITQNLGQKDIAEKLCVSVYVVRDWIKFYGLKKDWSQRMEVRKKRLLARYGVENVAQLDSVQEKKKKTCIERYGDTSPMVSEQVKEKRKQTNLARYGAETPMKCPDVIEKRRKTCLDRYGVDNVAKVFETKEKHDKFYFPEDIWPILHDKEKMREKIEAMPIRTAKAIAEEWGCTEATVYHVLNRLDLRDVLSTNSSNEEGEIGLFLDSLGIRHYRTRKILKDVGKKRKTVSKELDLYCPDYQIAIEYNGLYWHSLKVKEQNCHLRKCILAEKEGIKLFHVFEWEYKDDKEGIKKQIRALFSSKKVFPNNDFVLKREATTHYSLWFGEELVYKIFVRVKNGNLYIHNFFIYSEKEPEQKFEYFSKIAQDFDVSKIYFEAERGKIFDDFFEESKFVHCWDTFPRQYVAGGEWAVEGIYFEPDDFSAGTTLFIVEGCGDKVWVWDMEKD